MLERLRQLVQAGELGQALELCRSSRDVRYALPTLHLQRRDRPAALASIRVLVRQAHEPWDALALCRLGVLAADIGDFRLSVRCLQKALRLDPTATSARRALAGVHRRQALPSRIPPVLEPLFTRPPVPAWALHEMASCRAEEGDTDAALRFFRGAGDPFGLHQAAEILRRRGALDEARRLEAKVLSQDSGYPWSRWRRACDAASDGHYTRAVEELDQAQGLPKGQLKALWLDRQRRHPEARALRLEELPPRYRNLYGERLDLVQAGAVEWHALAGRHHFPQLTLFTTEPQLPALRWMSTVTFRPARLPSEASYRELEQAVVSGNDAWLARRLGVPAPREERGEVLLVVLQGENPWRATRGFGGYRLALVECDTEDVWSDTVILHELLHAGFGLGHTDGFKGPLDPLGVMGHQGSSVPFADAYLDVRQQCHITSPVGVGRLADEVWNLERRGRHEEARRALEALVAQDPLHLWGLSRLAWSRLRAGRTAEAFELLELPREVKLGTDPELLQRRFRLHEGQEAELETTPGYGRCPRACVLAGSARSVERQFFEARFDYALALGLDATGPHARLGIAGCDAARGNLREARQRLARLLEDEPRFAVALRRAALVAAQLQDFPEAARLLAASRSLQRQSADQAYCEGVVAWLQGEHERSVRLFQKALSWRQDCAEARYHLAYAALCLGRPRLAARHFEDVADRGGPAFPARCARVALDWLRGRRLDCRALLDQDPREASLLALLLLDAWRSKRGTARLCRRLARLEPRNPLLAKDFSGPFQNEFQHLQGEERGP